MAYSQYGDDWIDMISRCNYTLESDPEPTQTLEPDERFFGLHGLEEEFLYRVLCPNEDIQDAIVCKDPNSTRTVEQHIASGSRYDSRFISTTADRNVAANWAYYEMETPARKPRKDPLRIVEITVKKLIGTETEKECINLCNKEVREHFIKGAIHRNWAISSKEVLFQYKIQKYNNKEESIYDLAKVPKPPQPSPKKPEKKQLKTGQIEENMANLKL